MPTHSPARRRRAVAFPALLLVGAALAVHAPHAARADFVTGTFEVQNPGSNAFRNDFRPANGFATGQWDGGETERLVTRGIEREKAGSPPPAQIDAAFSILTRANGKDWLDFYRKRAKE